MSNRGEPLYKSRPVAPSPARFGWCTRVNDFISMSEGCSNTYLIETPEGNILINSGMGLEAPVHQSNFAELAGEIDGTIKYAIVTQGHTDHVGGIQYFRDRNPGLQLIAHANNEEHQTYDARLGGFRQARSAFRFTEAFLEAFEHFAASGYKDINRQDRPTADITFEDRYEFSIGGLDVVVIGQMGAETNDSLVVWLPQHRIVFTGNLFGCPFGHFPNLVTIRGDRYRDALVCAQAAQTVLDLEPEMILYGHHEPVVGAELIQREVTAYRDAIHYVHDAVVEGMNQGKDLATLQQEITLPPECEVGEGYGMVAWSIRAIWENYAGWFKHESTTELYSVPQKAIHADLLELAGAQAIIDRAEKKATAGQREEALHLLDIALSAEPGNEAATALSIDVHESLLEDARTFRTTGNFWLEGWLEQQIKLLKGGKNVSLREVLK
ncbi:MAG: alkyl sulfatase dimerization domain-containing protein [Myxococcota bacterium]|jgi:alkyl sulfatase BDS1-like metallo-beta-lactamase superfamily hydrolase|nr:alkyl sulfatase dimerization domain-containing protein [Myxococcota bacterium]